MINMNHHIDMRCITSRHFDCVSDPWTHNYKNLKSWHSIGHAQRTNTSIFWCFTPPTPIPLCFLSLSLIKLKLEKPFESEPKMTVTEVVFIFHTTSHHMPTREHQHITIRSCRSREGNEGTSWQTASNPSLLHTYPPSRNRCLEGTNCSNNVTLITINVPRLQ